MSFYNEKNLAKTILFYYRQDVGYISLNISQRQYFELTNLNDHGNSVKFTIKNYQRPKP